MKTRTRPMNRADWEILSMACFGLVFVAIFAYAPMYGIILAFKDGDGYLNIMKAITDSPWAGFYNFVEFLYDPDFIDVMWNTIGLNLLQLAINFPAPIIFAILLSEIKSPKFKKTIQTITYFPHFLSWVIFGGIILLLLNPDTGAINQALLALGLIQQPINFGEPQYFWGLIVITSLIKGLGWGAIIYIAAIAGIDPQLFESAKMDGANRFQRIWHITIPSIAPTITLFFILSLSSILNNGFDHIWVFQNQINLSASEVLDTYIYKVGIASLFPRYSYTTAVGVFKSVVGLGLLLTGQKLSKKLTGRGIF